QAFVIVNIQQTLASAPLTVNLRTGGGQVEFGSSAHNLNVIQGAVTINSGLGTDTVNVHDEANPGNQTFTMTANLMSGNDVPLLDTSIVTSNGGGNTLMGNHGGSGEMNLFYGSDPSVETTDYNPGIGEQFINC